MGIFTVDTIAGPEETTAPALSPVPTDAIPVVVPVEVAPLG